MDPVVTVAGGRLRGRWEGDTAVFLGIPYAQPPFGPDRFGPPRPVPPWEGERLATAYGPTAPQPHRQMTIIPEPIIEGEDCLNLNVFTPDPGHGGLPVLVWIHGGGFTAGCNNSPWYRGEGFARGGVVVVSVNYRLGAEGFLVVPGAPSNRGVLDWLAALRWVKDNVAAFGGDADRVTIAGQSAGGVACATLLASPAATDLFGAAVCMSGSRLPSLDLDEAEELTGIMSELLGVSRDRAGFSSVSPGRLVEVQEDAAAALGRSRSGVRLPFGPVLDGEVVAGREGLGQAVSGGRPLMLGATAEEFNSVPSADPGPGERVPAWRRVTGVGRDDARLGRRLARLGLDDAGAAAYRAAMPDASPSWVLGQALTDSWFRAPALWLADQWAAGGGRAWMYSFEWRSAASTGLGAVHCLDVPFAFDNLGAAGVEEVTGPTPPQPLADAVHGAWVRFVTEGDPGWSPWAAGRGPAMVFDLGGGEVDDPWPLVRRTWLAQRTEPRPQAAG